jgi:hypothetical protein
LDLRTLSFTFPPICDFGQIDSNPSLQPAKQMASLSIWRSCMDGGFSVAREIPSMFSDSIRIKKGLLDQYAQKCFGSS